MKPKVRANEFTDFGGPGAFDPTPLERHIQAQNLTKLVGKTVFDLINNPPRIHRIPHNNEDLLPVIHNAGVEEKDTHYQTDLTLTIPANGAPFQELLQKTGLNDMEAILRKLTDLAREENMQIIIAWDTGETLEKEAENKVYKPSQGTECVIVNLHRDINLALHPRLREENEVFLDSFEWELF